jgi:glycosyltransferase involved in cell wall biosynthesis
MDSPLVSILTRTRNRPRFLARARESVLGQHAAPPFEWIVVNDAGDPRLVEEILQPAQSSLPQRLHVLHLPHSKGMEHASNRGLRLATAPYLVIHDDDDSWEPDFLQQMIGWLEEPDHASFAGVVCHSTLIRESADDETIRPIGSAPFNAWLTRIDPWRLLQENPFPPISFVFRRHIWEELGGFDEGLPVLGDWEFNLRVALLHPIGVLPKPLARYHHRVQASDPDHANSVTAGNDLHQEWERRLRCRWLSSPPLQDLPFFGAISQAAATTLAASRTRAALLSLPLRPGPQ